MRQPWLAPVDFCYQLLLVWERNILTVHMKQTKLASGYIYDNPNLSSLKLSLTAYNTIPSSINIKLNKKCIFCKPICSLPDLCRYGNFINVTLHCLCRYVEFIFMWYLCRYVEFINVTLHDLCRYVDFLNIMAYDFHGGWDRFTGGNSPLFARHGNFRFDHSLSQVWVVIFILQLTWVVLTLCIFTWGSIK